MTEGFETLEGWYTLHDFRSMDWSLWNMLEPDEQRSVMDELFALLNRFKRADDKREGSFALFDIVGHKADFVFLNLREKLSDLSQLERELNKTQFANYATSSYSYVSVVELSNYVVGHASSAEADAMIKARLYPQIPQTQHICFYPMNKRRDGTENNWYLLPLEERRRMMKNHGMLGRKYAGQVTQMIGGSIGLDDWEWCVSLFADDPLTFKRVVTDMRFDEVSARFADFGGFYVGNRMTLEQLRKALG